MEEEALVEQPADLREVAAAERAFEIFVGEGAVAVEDVGEVLALLNSSFS